jgi:ArsR family transcriptional regulator, arsenate/arsenite/antimonite-responsive transcriptional repressor
LSRSRRPGIIRYSTNNESRSDMDTESTLHRLASRATDATVRGPADQALAQLAKALGHPVRAAIVRLLAAQETCQYGDLSDRLPLAKSTVSQHLKILREAGLVRVETDGPRVCYCIDPAGLHRLKALVGEL